MIQNNKHPQQSHNPGGYMQHQVMSQKPHITQDTHLWVNHANQAYPELPILDVNI